ncbi:MAG: toxic anion resistance protein, partial [Deltaproteobacteria bacterium]|nr:toxic anion resistance protein [Deltaproteobacteria bacterium]
MQDSSENNFSADNNTIPVKPTNLNESENKELVERASEIIQRLEEEPEEREVVKQIDALGVDEQRKAARSIELLKGRVGELLKDTDGKEAVIPNCLIDLRIKLDEINPHKLAQPGGFGKLLGKTPVVGKALKKIAVKYEEVNKQIDIIIVNLRDGQDNLLKDNAEMEQLYNQIKIQQGAIQRQAYLGEILINRLEEILTQESDEAKRKKIEAALN